MKSKVSVGVGCTPGRDADCCVLDDLNFCMLLLERMGDQMVDACSMMGRVMTLYGLFLFTPSCGGECFEYVECAPGFCCCLVDVLGVGELGVECGA